MLTSADAHARHLIVPDFAIRGDIGDQVTEWCRPWLVPFAR
jgi:hypothetical protein